ncbi:hypothetical protein [Streptomyces sp. NPDC088246]|uniref:hypothetical protein n=1 Tax=Streptomyces sp. NPDC088246 TaxID=3365842 RepID=UPI0037FD0C48
MKDPNVAKERDRGGRLLLAQLHHRPDYRPVGKPATGRIKSGFLSHDKVGSAMTRADIAAFLVSQLTDTRYSRVMPAISH